MQLTTDNLLFCSIFTDCHYWPSHKWYTISHS